MSEKNGINGDVGGSYQFLQKLNAQLAGVWESEIMLSAKEVENMQEGWNKIRDELSVLQKHIDRFAQLSTLREKLNEPIS